MKNNTALIKVLNSLLVDELTAIKRYTVQSEMCADWGYGKLHWEIKNQAMDETIHAEWLIERIIFFDGAPAVSSLNTIKVGKTVSEMICNNENRKLDVVHSYNNAIKHVREVYDQETLELLTRILIMEEGHVDWAEKQSAQIDQMGLKNYLVHQTVSCTNLFN
jgi:bacterioferritin